MGRPRSRTALAILTAALLLGAGCARSQPTAQAAKGTTGMTKLNAAEVAHAKSGVNAVLPQGATKAVVQDAQAMIVGGEVALVPVSYEAAVPNAVMEGVTRSECGVYVAAKGGAARFVPTVGVGNTETVECRDVAAVGAATQTARPDVILIYHVYRTREDFLLTILLTWDGKAGTYAVDDALSEWLGEQKDGQTVAGARRLLAKKRASGAGAGA